MQQFSVNTVRKQHTSLSQGKGGSTVKTLYSNLAVFRLKVKVRSTKAPVNYSARGMGRRR